MWCGGMSKRTTSTLSMCICVYGGHVRVCMVYSRVRACMNEMEWLASDPFCGSQQQYTFHVCRMCLQVQRMTVDRTYITR